MWGDRSWFHPGCQVEDSVLFDEELLEEIGGGSIRKSFAGSENLSDDGGCLSMGIGVLFIICSPCGSFCTRVGEWCTAGHVAHC